MPYCNNCGAELEGRADFCCQCGQRQEHKASLKRPEDNGSPRQPWWLAVVVAVLVVAAVGLGWWAWSGSGAAGRTAVAIEGEPLRLQLRNGFEVFVPAGALLEGSQVSVRLLSPGDSPPLPEGFETAIELYEVTADTSLAAPAILRLPLPEPGPEEVYQLHHFHDGQWEPLPFEVDSGFAVVSVERFSLFAWLNMRVVQFAEWADEKLITYLNPETYITWYRKRTGVEEFLEIPLEKTSPEIRYDDSVSRELIAASAQLVHDGQVRLRVRNETQVYLQVSFEASAPVKPKRGGYFDLMEAVKLAVRLSSLPWGGGAWIHYASDLMADLGVDDAFAALGEVLILPGRTAEFETSLQPGEELTVRAHFGPLAQFYTVVEPVLMLVPLADAELGMALRDVMVAPMEVQALGAALGRAGLLLGEEVLRSVMSPLVVPVVVQWRKTYLEGRIPEILQQGGTLLAGGSLTFTSDNIAPLVAEQEVEQDCEQALNAAYQEVEQAVQKYNERAAQLDQEWDRLEKQLDQAFAEINARLHQKLEELGVECIIGEIGEGEFLIKPECYALPYTQASKAAEQEVERAVQEYNQRAAQLAQELGRLLGELDQAFAKINARLEKQVQDCEEEFNQKVERFKESYQDVLGLELNRLK
ncbi:hypothetical protein HKBW3S42_00916 [Candidatus Hakubella thermalkaliphila]|uniref:Zinc-ribbon domain-containing protein n=1 Tax=Candidatus Hakubella thermalkaliphila TaxID=2754717 RepID=A0A6V8PIV8_9ACTN|nr:hypothetical protein HKBW3S42_00916 [Candidatus Hakubella thermalkaliphila]GFP43717.1 hypothetical protein HKBW3C_02846 [Candidatus Hakubella thermalkaliphila]